MSAGPAVASRGKAGRAIQSSSEMAPKNSHVVAKRQSKPAFREKKSNPSGHKSRFSCFVNAGETEPPDAYFAPQKPENQIDLQDVACPFSSSALQNACLEANQDVFPPNAEKKEIIPLIEPMQDIIHFVGTQKGISPHSSRHPDDHLTSYPVISPDLRSSHSDSTLNILSSISTISSWDIDDELMIVSMLEVVRTPGNINTTANNKPTVNPQNHNISGSEPQPFNINPWPDLKFENVILPPNSKQTEIPANSHTCDLPQVHIIAPIKNRDSSPVSQRQVFSITRGKCQSTTKRSLSSTNCAGHLTKDLKINTTQQQQRRAGQERNISPPRLTRFGGIYIEAQTAPNRPVPQRAKFNGKDGPKFAKNDEPPTPMNTKPTVWSRNNRWKKPSGLLSQVNKDIVGSVQSSANQSPPCARPNITSSNMHSQAGENRGAKLNGLPETDIGSQHYLRKPFEKSRGHSFKNRSEFWRRMLKTHKSKFLMASSRLKKRMDWSTDSGYAESVSRVSHDWLTGWGVSKEEMLLTANNDGIKSLQASLGRSLSHSSEKKGNSSVTYSLSLTTVKELSDNTSLQSLLISNKASRKRTHSTLSYQETAQASNDDKTRRVMKSGQSVYSTDLSLNVSDTRSIRSEWTSNGLGTDIASEWDSGAVTRYCDGDTQEQVTVLQRLKTHVFNIRWSCGNACPDDLFIKKQNVPMVSLSDISDYALQMGNSTDKSQNQETYVSVVKTGFNSNTRRTIERGCHDSPVLTRRSSAILSEAIFSQNTRFFSLDCSQHRIETMSPANSLENIPVGGQEHSQSVPKMNGRNGAVKRWLGAQELPVESLTQTSYGMVANFTRNLWVKKALYRLRKKPNDFKGNPDSSWKWPIFLLIVVFIIFICLLLAYLLTTTSLTMKDTTEILE